MKRTLFKLEPMMRKRRQHLSEREINVRCFVFGQPQSRETIMLKLANPNVGFFFCVLNPSSDLDQYLKKIVIKGVLAFFDKFSAINQVYTNMIYRVFVMKTSLYLFAWVFDDTGWHFPVVNRLSLAIFLIMLSKLIL